MPQISAAGLLTFLSTVPGVRSLDGAEESGVVLLLVVVNREEVLRRVSSASASIRWIRALHDGMSWINPMTWPAVHTFTGFF